MALASKDWQLGRLINPKWSTASKPESRLVGIELEYEHVTGIQLGNPHGSDPKPLLTSRWHAVQDGSLRNQGGEFVSIPIPVSQVSSALSELFTAPGASKWQTSIRTGLHVHVDVRDFNLDELRCLLTAYCLSEPALFNYVGIEREENVFCVPWYRAPADMETVLTWLDHKGGPNNASDYFNHLSKYDALNLMPIIKFGTVEFRHAQCTKDKAYIAEWAHICTNVVELALKYTQEQLLQAYLIDPNNFPRTYISPLCHMMDYEARMLRSNAEWLANQTLKVKEVFDPRDKSQWIRLNDKIPYDPKALNPYLRVPKKKQPASTVQQVQQHMQQTIQTVAQELNQWQPPQTFNWDDQQ